MLNVSERDRPIGSSDYIGWALWATGMLFEILADFQKSAFKRNPDNKVNTSSLHSPLQQHHIRREGRGNYGDFLGPGVPKNRPNPLYNHGA